MNSILNIFVVILLAFVLVFIGLLTVGMALDLRDEWRRRRR